MAALRLGCGAGERYMQQRKEQTSRRGLTQGVRPGCEFVLRVRCALLGARRAVNYFSCDGFCEDAFALVCSHLVAFTFFPLGMIAIGLCLTIEIYLALEVVLYLFHKHLGGLESRDAVLGDDDGSVL